MGVHISPPTPHATVAIASPLPPLPLKQDRSSYFRSTLSMLGVVERVLDVYFTHMLDFWTIAACVTLVQILVERLLEVILFYNRIEREWAAPSLNALMLTFLRRKQQEQQWDKANDQPTLPMTAENAIPWILYALLPSVTGVWMEATSIALTAYIYATSYGQQQQRRCRPAWTLVMQTVLNKSFQSVVSLLVLTFLRYAGGFLYLPACACVFCTQIYVLEVYYQKRQGQQTTIARKRSFLGTMVRSMRLMSSSCTTFFQVFVVSWIVVPLLSLVLDLLAVRTDTMEQREAWTMLVQKPMTCILWTVLYLNARVKREKLTQEAFQEEIQHSFGSFWQQQKTA